MKVASFVILRRPKVDERIRCIGEKDGCLLDVYDLDRGGNVLEGDDLYGGRRGLDGVGGLGGNWGGNGS